ncbi:terpene cyclase/mutase family protein [Kiritimatiellota bacterium B12222]|nr:terpene cyclase/mutase family protein [Kiritimatiellota bacterium B12222]
MKIEQSNRVAHVSSIAFSFVLNLVLFLALLLWAHQEKGKDDQIHVITAYKESAMEEVFTPEDFPPEISDPVEAWETGCTLPDLEPMIPKLDSDFQEPASTAPENLPALVTTNVGVLFQEGIGSGVFEKMKIQILTQATPETVGASSEAVEKALQWLVAHQHENGGWSKHGDVTGGGVNAGYTGLALLTFLADGATPSSQEYGETVAKGIRFLVENQDEQGLFQPAGSHTAYGHAIATYAMAEAYHMTENPLLRYPVARAAAALVRGQMSNGGFDYDYKHENRNDLSLGAWHVQALKAVVASGAAGPEAELALQRAMDGMLLGSKLLPSGGRGFTYTVSNERVGAPRRIISSAGTLGLCLTGRTGGSEIRESLKYISQCAERDQLPHWGAAVKSEEHGGELMLWYYTVQAFYESNPESKSFKRYTQYMVKALSENQEADGHWPGYTEKGKQQGALLNTTLGALSLMTPYRRILPSMMERLEDPSPVDVAEEVGFEI